MAPRPAIAIIVLVMMAALSRDDGGGLGREERGGRGQEGRGRRELVGGALVLGDVGLGVPVVEVPGATVHQRPPRLRQGRVLGGVPRPARCAAASSHTRRTRFR